MGGVNQLRGQSLPQVLKFPPAARRMPFNLLGMARAALAVNCGVSVSRAGSTWVDSGNNMGADHGPRGGGDQRFLGDLLVWGSWMEGLVGKP
jgi:hypothetical protein